jgi:hypothetical protein
MLYYNINPIFIAKAENCQGYRGITCTVPVQQNNERIKALISMHPDHPKKKKNPSSTIILVTSVLASWGGGVGKTNNLSDTFNLELYVQRAGG